MAQFFKLLNLQDLVVSQHENNFLKITFTAYCCRQIGQTIVK